MEAVFIRHGQAVSNLAIRGRLVGEEAPLTPEGRRQIEAAAHYLGPLVTTNVLHTSPLVRTKESAQLIAERCDLTVVIEPRLREIGKGDWTGMPVEAVIKLEGEIDIKHRHTFRPPGEGGENWQDVGTRMAAFIEEQRQAGSKQLLMVSHDHPIRMGIGTLMGKPIEEWENMPIANASITRLYYEDGFWQLDETLANKIVY